MWFVGALAGFFAAHIAAALLYTMPEEGKIKLRFIGLVIGVLIGWERSFSLRVKAQELSALRQIEINTRGEIEYEPTEENV